MTGGTTSGERLASKMQERGIGKRRLSRESGVSYRTVTRLMRGDMVGSVYTWARICRALSCRISDIVDVDGEGDGR